MLDSISVLWTKHTKNRAEQNIDELFQESKLNYGGLSLGPNLSHLNFF